MTLTLMFALTLAVVFVLSIQGQLSQLSRGQLSDIMKAKFHNRAVQCNFSEKFVFRNYSCFAKSYSRTISTVNVIATAKMPLYNIFLFAELFYKYGVIYRQVLKTSLIDVCGIMDMYKDNILVQQLIVGANAHAPGLIHECPYEEVICRNITPKPEVAFSLIPSGEYKYIQTFYTSNEIIGYVTFIIEVNSADKNSFG